MTNFFMTAPNVVLLCSEPRRRSGEARPTSVQPGRTTTVTTVADIFCPIVHWQALRHEGNLCAPTAAADVASDPPHLVRPELADRLEVGTRTVRRDVDMLRDLGYPVNAVQGITGGYRLGAGP